MKICEEFAALLDAFVDGELSPEEAQAVQTHLNTCTACQAYVDDALAMRAAFPTVQDTEVPADFAEGVINAIRTQSASPVKKHRQPWGRVLLPIAACFALVLVLKTAAPTFHSDKAAPNLAGGGFSSEARVCDEAPTEASTKAAAKEAAPKAADEEIAPEAAEQPAPEPEENVIPADPESQAPVTTYDSSKLPSVLRDGTAPSYFARITITAKEAGDLLNRFTPISKTETEQVYELSESDYHVLLESLSAAGISPAAQVSEVENTGTLALVTVLY